MPLYIATDTRILAMSDDDFDELMEMVEREEAERNRNLGLDVMDVVNICHLPRCHGREIHATF